MLVNNYPSRTYIDLNQSLHLYNKPPNMYKSPNSTPHYHLDTPS
ncbi:hypothetical protein [Rubritalea tangerina]